MPPDAPPSAHADSSRAEQTALGRLAGVTYDRRRRVVVAWVLLLIVVTAVSQSVGAHWRDKFGSGHSPSQQVQDLLATKFPARAGDSADVVFKTAGSVTAPAQRAAVVATMSRFRGLAHVSGVQSPFDVPGQVSRDGHIAAGTVQFDNTTINLPKSAIQKVVDIGRAVNRPGFQVELGGQPIDYVVSAKPGSSEAIGILAAIVILLIAFGSVIAMGLPIGTALIGIGIGAGIVTLLSHGLIVPSFGTELAAMIGIGVGIDYALFIVTRYRQGLQSDRTPRDAVIMSMATSGRAVLFAGCTVVISLLGMLLLGQPFVYGLSFGAIAAVVLVMASALTLLPALLGFTGRAIDRLHVPRLIHHSSEAQHHTFWWRWSRVVQRRPLVLGAAALAILVVLAIPLFGMHMAFSDDGNAPSSLTTRRAYDLLAEGFGPGRNGPLVLAAELPGAGGRQTVATVAQRIGTSPGVAFVAPPSFNAAGDTAVVLVVPATSPQDLRTQSLVRRLRNEVIPPVTRGTGVKVLVGGVTAAAVDSAHDFSLRLPWVIGGVVVLSFLLLMAVFRSVAVPLKAAVMNLLSIGAAYGVIVAVFQWGWLGSVVGITKTAPIEPWVPLMLFTILFGLSMDYEVFLLSRIREEWRRTGDNATAVADGLASTARVITAAAAIMVCVFGSFVIGDQLRVLKLFGLGLATAIFVDATVVRMVLVPATMELLGNANWWLPRWLDRAVPTLTVDIDTDPVVFEARDSEAVPVS
ncbi:MAG TPA: MMPL family transporter [Acidimicrobiales bacterium]|nr:MMPL family transporter [Acidimicrobiales bacterium]